MTTGLNNSELALRAAVCCVQSHVRVEAEGDLHIPGAMAGQCRSVPLSPPPAPPPACLRVRHGCCWSPRCPPAPACRVRHDVALQCTLFKGHIGDVSAQKENHCRQHTHTHSLTHPPTHCCSAVGCWLLPAPADFQSCTLSMRGFCGGFAAFFWLTKSAPWLHSV